MNHGLNPKKLITVNIPKDKETEGIRKYLSPDAERYISPKDIAKADKEAQIEIMKTWFYQHYEDPAEHTPRDDGEYVYIWGGPYDAREELTAEFEDVVPQKAIEELAEELNGQSMEWSGKAWANEDAGIFVFNIEENALSSLKHGVEHFIGEKTDDNLKFAIIHIFHALELFLKARLAKAHPLLIYDKPEDTINDNTHTVNFKTLIKRLINIGVKIPEAENLENLQGIRNCIEHHKVEADKEEVENYIARVAKFLDSFLHEELNISLKKKMPSHYETLSKVIYSYEERLKKASEEMEKYVAQNKACAIELCPECSEFMIPIPVPVLPGEEKIVRCYFCQKEFTAFVCDKCSKLSVSETKMLLTCNNCSFEDYNQRKTSKKECPKCKSNNVTYQGMGHGVGAGRHPLVNKHQFKCQQCNYTFWYVGESP